MEKPNNNKPKWMAYYYIINGVIGLLLLIANYEGGNDFLIIIATGFILSSIYGHFETKREKD